MISRRLSWLCAASFSIWNTLPLAAETNQSNDVIRIGFVTHLTGVASEASHDMLDGMNLYLDQIHNKMGGKPVKLIVENDEASPATSVAKVKKLIESDHCQILDGLLLGHIGYADAPVVESEHVPMVYAVAASDDITQRKHYNWVVRTGWNSSAPTHPFGEYVRKQMGFTHVATLGMDYPFGWEVVGGFQKSFEEAGGQVVQKLWAPLGFQEFTPFLTKLDKKADALFLLTSNVAATIIPKEIKTLGIKLPVVAGGTTLDESVLPHLGDEVIGWVSVSPYSAALNTAANKKFVSAFESKYHRVPSFFAEGGYTSGMWIAKAVNDLHGDVSNNEKLLAALKKVELADAPRGPVKLDDRANPIENMYVRKVERVHGKLQNTVIHTFNNVGQFWHWNPSDFLKQPVYTKDYPPCKFCEKS